MSACECRGCGKRFGRVSTFDSHMVGVGSRRRCLSVMEMQERGFKLNPRMQWTAGGGYWASSPAAVISAEQGAPAVDRD